MQVKHGDRRNPARDAGEAIQPPGRCGRGAGQPRSPLRRGPYAKLPGRRLGLQRAADSRLLPLLELRCLLLNSQRASPLQPTSSVTAPAAACPWLSLDTLSEASSADLWEETDLGRQDPGLQDPGPSSLLAAGRPNRCPTTPHWRGGRAGRKHRHLCIPCQG